MSKPYLENDQKKRERLKQKSKSGFLKIIFGRSMLITLLLAMQILLLIGFGLSWQYTRVAASMLWIVSFAMAFVLINRQNMRDSSVKTWLIMCLLLPIVGTAMFLWLELDAGHRAVKRRMEEIEKMASEMLPFESADMAKVRREEKELYDLARYLYRFGGYPLYKNTQVKYFPSGEKKFEALLRELEKAEHFIFLEYFIIREGEMWNSILEILARKAKQGVEVRVMYDGTNSLFNLPYHYPRKLENMGIKCKVFSPFHPIISSHYNNRDHRKIIVIDNKVAFTGGINLADEYIGKRVVYGHWKDAAILLRGEAVCSFTRMFLEMWNVTEREPEFKRYLALPTGSYPEAKGYVMPYGDDPFIAELMGENVYLDMINRSNHYVHIMTGYLIIDETMTDALIFAAKRGVDVKILLPHIPDKKSAFALAYTHYRKLLNAGVRIYEYTPGFVHAKTMVCDGRKAVVGSINLDYRSLALHFECAAYLYNVPEISEIEMDFVNTMQKCEEITLGNIGKVRLYRKILGRILKVLAPLM